MASRNYERWNIEQDKELLDLYAEGTKLGIIANKLNRTSQAIKLRLEHLCFNYYKTDMVDNKNAILLKYYEKSKHFNKLEEENLILKNRIEALEKQLNETHKSI